MSALSTAQIDRLVQAASSVRERAYAPHSQFLVGAAILSGDEIFVGCNVENASFGLTICAERAAATAAVAGGRRSWKAIALASAGGVTPCGACRQFLSEFEPQLPVILFDVNKQSYREVTMADLLPDSFDSNCL